MTKDDRKFLVYVLKVSYNLCGAPYSIWRPYESCSNRPQSEGVVSFTKSTTPLEMEKDTLWKIRTVNSTSKRSHR